LRLDIALAPCRKKLTVVYYQGVPRPACETNAWQEGYHPPGLGEFGLKARNLIGAAIKQIDFNAAKHNHHPHADFIACLFAMRNQKLDS
jgi:hypothetical protein